MLTAAQAVAATLTALGASAKRCAEKAGVCSKTVERWRKDPEFRVLVLSETTKIREEIRTTGAAVKETRLRGQKKRLAALYGICRKRGGNPECGGADWDGTGLMVQRVKWVGPSEGGSFETEYELDTGMLKAMLDLENAIAEEVGDRVKAALPWGGRLSLPPTLPPVSAEARTLAQLLGRDQIQALISGAGAVLDVRDDGTVITEPGESDSGGEPEAPGGADK